MIGQQRDVIDPFAQGRHGDGHAAQAVEQVLAELAGLHPFHQVLLGGRHHPRRGIAHRVEHPHDLALRGLPQIAHLVEQDRAALGPRDHGGGPVHPLQVAGCSDDEGQRAPVGEIMDRPGDQAFAGPAFAGDQHRQLGVHHPRHQPVKRLHRRRAPHQRQILLLGRDGCSPLGFGAGVARRF
jgi:hypothetical protein